MPAGSGLFNESPVQGRYVQGKGGVAGEVDDLRQDVARNLQPLAAITVVEFVDPIASAADALLAAAATVAAEVVLETEDLDATTLADMLDAPRQLVFTTAGVTPADAPATAFIKGKDARGKPITETVTIAQTATTATSNNFFSEVDSITYPAADGTDATVAIGIGGKLGLKYAPKAFTAGGQVVLAELEDNAAAGVAGTVTPVGASDLPYGSYTPNSALNGALDFVVVYAFDPTV